MLNTTVFDAFPNAIEEWGIGEISYSTVIGNVGISGTATKIHAIVDEGSNTNPNPGSDAQDIGSDTLLYCRPDEMPTLDTAELCATYIVGRWNGGKYYSIIDAALGKNQETGKIEHVELRIRQTDATIIEASE